MLRVFLIFLDEIGTVASVMHKKRKKNRAATNKKNFKMFEPGWKNSYPEKGS